MEYESEEAAKTAYEYYVTCAEAVEPDSYMQMAEMYSDEAESEAEVFDDTMDDIEDNTESDEENTIESEIISIEDEALAYESKSAADEAGELNFDEDESANVFDVIEDMLQEFDEAAAEAGRAVIALIDTGASEGENVISRLSVIDESLSGGTHADAMVEAITALDAKAQIISIRALDDNGKGTIASVVSAIELAIELDADIINLSLYAKKSEASSVIQGEIEKACEAGIIVVGAAGNDAADAALYIPGAAEAAYIIGACDNDGVRISTSNYGETVDYNVTADSTSVAAATFTGFISLSGTDEIESVLNAGLIFACDYEPDEEEISTQKADTDGRAVYIQWNEISEEESEKEASEVSAAFAGDSVYIYHNNDTTYPSYITSVSTSAITGFNYWRATVSSTQKDYRACCLNASLDGSGANQNNYTAKEYTGTNAEAIKVAILAMPLNAIGNIFTDEDMENLGLTNYSSSKELYMYWHIAASYLYSSDYGPLTGTSYASIAKSLASWCKSVASDGYFTTDGTTITLSNYTFYYVDTGDDVQDIGWVEKNLGKITISKSSSNTDISEDNANYSLKGAVYTVYGSYSGGSSVSGKSNTYTGGTLSGKVGTITIGSGGTGSLSYLPIGTYYIKETTAPTGYTTDSYVYKVTLTSSSYTKTLSVTDAPGYDTADIEITKLADSDSSDLLPSLEGTQFTITFYGGQYSSVSAAEAAVTKSSIQKRTWVFEVKADSSNVYKIKLSDDYKVSGDELFYSGNTVILPYGTYVIEETKAAAGYSLAGYLKDKSGNIVASSSDASTGIVYIANVTSDSSVSGLSGGNTYTMYNSPLNGQIKIIKYADNKETPLQGVTYELSDSDGNVLSTEVTGSDGIAVFEDLYPGVYTLVETAAAEGYSLLKDEITVTLPMTKSLATAK